MIYTYRDAAAWSRMLMGALEASRDAGAGARVRVGH